MYMARGHAVVLAVLFRLDNNFNGSSNQNNDLELDKNTYICIYNGDADRIFSSFFFSLCFFSIAQLHSIISSSFLSFHETLHNNHRRHAQLNTNTNDAFSITERSLFILNIT